MVGLGIYTGLRLGDVVTFRWDYIDWEKHSFSLVPSKTGRGRRGASKRVSFALHPVLEALLLELRGSARKPTGYLFPELAAEYQKGNRNVATKRIQAFFEGCGIATHRPGTGKWRDEEGRVVDSGRGQWSKWVSTAFATPSCRSARPTTSHRRPSRNWWGTVPPP